ncbi:unnamed protein product [Dovyalis caffra]|uniref:Uncharacterized protein n=1 Tax=Dovyalis caffra TaxID=77055 RepID=A0AAV1RNI8_9ROSI|nr:unnamed protein product [Dovyalis caffra]
MKLSSKSQFPVSIYKAKKLRSLLMINAKNPSLGATLPDLFKQLTCLRSLSLSGSSIQEKEAPATFGTVVQWRENRVAS